MTMSTKRCIAVSLIALAITGCSTIASGLLSMASPSKGIEATAQVGSENNKSTLALRNETSKSAEVGDVAGDSNLDSSNTIINDWKLVLGTMALGMLPFLALLFWVLPAPKWIQRRYNSNDGSTVVSNQIRDGPEGL